ncbi:protein PTST homolog 2, chloroplastic isoform X2 [Rhododendron vialii]|uniref:protein PTST homolog 2, chloroplastic isoform X2 n=1 Tax=Rhododendron vialii TaxID=182163 RepID=UPI002660593E|nr:protein PTST homolog 2, chloroplastic isoform X2 [Rhododendron vialii]
MSSLITTPHHFLFLPGRLNSNNSKTASSPLTTLIVNPRTHRPRHQGIFLDTFSLGFRKNFKNKRYYYYKAWESEGDLVLESEILEFMKKSEKPGVFPSKEELVNAGRMDLVEAIVKEGGWLSMGWDLGNHQNEEQEKVQEVIDITARVSDDSCRVSRVSSDSSHSPSSSGRSFGMRDEQESGIEGILTRLENQRNLLFGGNGYSNRASSKDDGGDSHIETSRYGDSADLGRSSRLASGSCDNGIDINRSGSKLNHSRSVADFDGSMSSEKPESWQAWSIQRAGFSDSEFEEISFMDNQIPEEKVASDDEFIATTECSAESLNKPNDISNNEIRTRVHHLELELTSALCVLRTKSVEHVPKEVHETSNDLHKISDAWEFQENEIMKAKDRLRSIRAKLAVLEGKMTLAIIDAQKKIEEKQKRIDGGRRALQLVRTTCVVWPNPASEVLLAGSFDGWTTQRKMEKSSSGIFSVCLKLYPGKYEIKFIVDGVWKTDPLRPIVRNNGYENNLHIVA